MAFTDTGMGTGAGKVYDVNEGKRLMDISNEFNKYAEEADNTDNKKKDIIRYAVIGAGAVLILVTLKILVKRKK